MPVDRTATPPERVYLNEDGSERDRSEFLTLKEKIERLESTFGKDAMRYGHAYSYVNLGTYWEPKIVSSPEPRPEKVHYDDVHNVYGNYGTYCNSPATDPPHRAFIDLSDVAMDANPYGSSTSWHQSNMRSLQRDYPGMFTVIGYSNVDSLGSFIGNLTEEMVGILCSLRADYPLYDEEDCTQLEMEWAEKSWPDYVCRDISREIEEIAGQEALDLWTALDGVPAPDGDSATDMHHQIFISAETQNEGNPFWSVEADGAIWDYKELVPAMAAILHQYFTAEPVNPGQLFFPWRTEEQETRKKLEEIRASLRAENISYGELIELQSLAACIDPGDIELLEAAGIPEEGNTE